MMLIDSHAHMLSRTTDDYEAMAAAGVVAVAHDWFEVAETPAELTARAL